MMVTFKSKFLIDIYRLTLRGYNLKYISKKIGVTQAAISQWKRKHPGVDYALELAEKDRKEIEDGSFGDYLRGKLSPGMQKYWDRMNAYERQKTGYAKIQTLLKDKGTRFKQKMVIYSLIACGFNKSKALRRCGVGWMTFKRWQEHDPYFAELLMEVKENLKDFYESALIKLVKSGDSPATIYANRVYNRDRGYGEKTQIESTVNVNVATIPIAELDLPVEVKRVILEAMEEHRKRKQVQSAIVNKGLLPGIQSGSEQIGETV